MKLPKAIKRYCPHCKKATEQKVEFYKSGGKRSSFSRGSIQRARKRGQGRGSGNLGKWGSKPPITRWKRTGAKGSKKTTLMYTCKVYYLEMQMHKNLQTEQE